ncbi:MAG: manganese-dependent inorganic pyrophosphatase [Patescibacteria group bacterium]
MSTTYVLGHKKPDTDSVAAAMALTHLYQNRPCFGYSNPVAAIADPLNPETSFLFEKFGLTAPKLITAADIQADDQIVLVDHNEASQRLDGLNPDQIVEIVDHHKANLNLSNPIFMTFKTWGSSCTIIYYLMKQQDLTPEKNLASLMLAAILSDTVGFRGPTCTDKDKEIGLELAKIAGIDDIDALALEVLKAKSDVSKLSDLEIVRNDYKVFEFAQPTFIDQLETVEQEKVLTEKKASLLQAMQQVKDEEKVSLLFVAISDTLKLNTKLLILGESERQVAEKAFGGQTQDNVLDIGSRMSRKKEIAPAIEKALAA